ncbi:hypothetical protein PC128_g21375 [Phytophthora cactorum]|nr:hypothetical protein PC128_g21375 [Phytophthora cactorum]
MTAQELATFSDIFMDLEYPVYAHLVPGQRFRANMSKAAILTQIPMGKEAALPQREAIQQFKSVVSRIMLNMETRVLKVTSKGKKSAQRWVNWKVPLGMWMLTLIDYEKQREEAS